MRKQYGNAHERGTLHPKTGIETEFVKRFEGMDHKGLSQSYLMRTGESNFTAVGIFDSKQDLIDARPTMICNLNSIRDSLGVISPDLGVTDPVSGPVVCRS